MTLPSITIIFFMYSFSDQTEKRPHKGAILLSTDGLHQSTHEMIRCPIIEFDEFTRGCYVLIIFVQEHMSMDAIVDVRDISLEENIVGFVAVSTNPCVDGVDHYSHNDLLGSKMILHIWLRRKVDLSSNLFQWSP